MTHYFIANFQCTSARPLGSINFWLNSESKAVILEVLTVLSRGVGQVSVAYKGMVAPPNTFSITHSTSFHFSNSVCGVVVVFHLVQQCNSDMTSEWPLEVVIKLSSHEVGKH